MFIRADAVRIGNYHFSPFLSIKIYFHAYVKYLLHDFHKDLLTQRHNTYTLRAMDKENIRVSPKLAKDPNYQAYKAEEAMLKQEHMGMWVAYADGKRVLMADNRESLFREAEEKGLQGFFFHQVVEKERVVHLRSPRIVRR